MRTAILLAVLVLGAGCTSADPASTAAPSSSPPPPAPVPEANETAGAIAGSVVDDEGRPLSGADVSLIETGAATKTDVSGAFTFNNLEAGTYRLVASLLGFTDAGRKVSVVPGEVAKITLTLDPLVIADEPYTLILPKTAYIHFGWVYLTDGPWGAGVNNTQYNSIICDPCRFTIHHDPTPAGVLTEALWLAGTTAPVLNNQVWLRYTKNVTAEAPYGTTVQTQYWSNRESAHWSAAGVAHLKKVSKHELWVQGDLLGVNFEHKVQILTSMSYRGPFPDGFTALPPA